MASKGPVLISVLKNKAPSQKELSAVEPVPEVKRPNSYGFVTKTYAETKQEEPPEKPEQIEDKVETNRGQSGDKVETNWRQNQVQSRDKLETIKNSILETRDKVGTKVETLLETNRGQSGDKVETNWRQKLGSDFHKEAVKSFESLVGLQRKILIIIFECTKESRNGTTDPISVSFLSMKTGAPINSVKKTLQRLEQAGFFVREEFKNGRCGWTKYRLVDSVYQKLINHETRDKLETKWVQTGDKVGTKPGTQPETSSLEEEDSSYLNRSSSSRVSQTTKILEPLPKDWMEINFSELTALNIPFGQNHLRQIHATARVSAQELQESINHYAYDLRYTPGRKLAVQNHLGYFLNSLKNGPYAPPKGYKSPVEIVRENYAASKREEAARIEKLNAEIFESEFSIWWNKLTLEEQKKITLSDGIRGKVESQRFFKDSVWPMKKEEMK